VIALGLCDSVRVMHMLGLLTARLFDLVLFVI